MIPESTYVSSLLMQLQQELQGYHSKVNEIEQLRYFEDKIALKDRERASGLTVHAGLAADLIETAKASLTANSPKVTITPLSSSDPAKANSSKREGFWNQHLIEIAEALGQQVDSQVGNGMGILKAVEMPWPAKPRLPLEGESPHDHLERVKALKRKWGLPWTAIQVHPMTFYWRRGQGNKIAEVIEHSWRPKLQVYAKYGLDKDADLKSKQQGRMLDPDVAAVQAYLLQSVSGQPEEVIRSLPAGQDTSTMCLVTEYWNEDVYQVYVNRRKLFEQEKPHVAYFTAIGRNTSSPDPDKYAVSVAEWLRVNEPTINRIITRMAESTDLIVDPRLALETPQGGFMPTVNLGETNNPKPATITFEPGKATTLPAGAKVHDIFEGVEAVYGAMPLLDLLLRLADQHGAAPIFKGMPPSASGSGYRDNSLYLMAKSQFNYLVESRQNALSAYIDWLEQQIAEGGEEVWIKDLSLKPSDISKFPARVEVKLDPALPQNTIAEGQFYMEAHDKGYGDRRWVLEKGFKEEQPEKLERARILEMAQDMMLEGIVMDAMDTAGIGKGPPAAPPPSGLVDTQGNPLAPTVPTPTPPGGAQQLLTAMREQGNTQGMPPTGAQAGGGQPDLPAIPAGGTM